LPGKDGSAGSSAAFLQAGNSKTFTVHVSYGGVEETFSGSVEAVWVSLSKFFSEFLPAFETAKMLFLNVDLKKLAGECESLIGLGKEGPFVLVPRSMLTDNELLSLHLLAWYLANQLGRAESSEVAKEELQARLGKDAKILSTRLGELVKNQLAAKTADEKYCITSYGLVQLQREIIPRIKSKMGN
jgi:hypothetical protein